MHLIELKWVKSYKMRIFIYQIISLNDENLFYCKINGINYFIIYKSFLYFYLTYFKIIFILINNKIMLYFVKSYFIKNYMMVSTYLNGTSVNLFIIIISYLLTICAEIIEKNIILFNR